jgi:hypothetical protein
MPCTMCRRMGALRGLAGNLRGLAGMTFSDGFCCVGSTAFNEHAWGDTNKPFSQSARMGRLATRLGRVFWF